MRTPVPTASAVIHRSYILHTLSKELDRAAEPLALSVDYLARDNSG